MPAIEPSLRLPLQLSNGLKWLAPEVDASLHRVRVLIEQQQDVEESALETKSILDELKLVQGALLMAGCCGGALFADELCAAVMAVAGGKLAQPAAALAAVSGATLQLSDYLDALQRDAPDRAAVLQPAISELRLASGRAAATEADLFVQQMQMRAVQLTVPSTPERVPGAAAAMAGKLLPVFQAMLLQWLKGVDGFNALLRLRKVGDHVANCAVAPDVLLLWTVFAAAADALMTAPANESLELKRSFGRMAQQIKLLAEQGEQVAQASAAEMAWRLMANAAVIDHYEGARWQALRKSLSLDSALPIASELASARRTLRGPNTRLLEKVAQEVRAELTLVKDTLDLAQRAGMLSVDGVNTTRDRLNRIANTLSLLGLTQLEQILRNQCSELELLGSKDAQQQGGWLRMATALLRVEYSLEMSMFRPLQVRSDVSASSESELIYAVPHAQDLRDSTAVLLREILVDLAKLKAQLDSFISGEALRDIDEPAALLDEVAAGLVILDRQQAAALVAHLHDWLQHSTPNAFRNDIATAVRFADAIAALELYLEALRDELPRPDLMLATLKDTVVFFEAESALLALDTVEHEPTPVVQDDLPVQSVEPPIVEAAPESAAAGIDPEIRAIFIEEVDEVSEVLKRLLPGFARDPSDATRVADIRRAFHTLKGSGRMVGALRIGELGWAVESLLNRCIEGAMPVNRAVVIVVEQAYQQLLVLRAAFYNAASDELDETPDPLIARAQYLASGRAPEMVEADVLGVFRTDALDRLADIERWLADDAAQLIDPDAARALHTLRGSASVVNAEALSQVSGALEAVLKQLIAADAPAPPEVRAVLIEAMPVLRGWIAHAGEIDDAQPDEWLSRIDALTHFLPPPGDNRSLVRRESLVNLAFDGLQAAEQQLQQWQSAPAAHGALVDTLQQLAATAQDCAPLSLCATAMAERLLADDVAVELAAIELLPPPVFIQGLSQALEHFYRFLDAYREGSMRDNGKALAATIRRLPLQGVALTATEVQAMLAPPPKADQDLIRLFAEEAQDLLGLIKTETQNWQAPVQPSPLLLQTLHTLMGSARIAGYVALGDLTGSIAKQLSGVPGKTADGSTLHNASVDVSAGLATLQKAFEIFASRTLLTQPEGNAAVAIHAADPELAGIFIAEAAEMLEAITTALTAWRLDPEDRGAIRALNRALHTLKGGARMTGFMQMGDASHEMESQVVALLLDKRAPTTAEFAALSTQLEALERMHDALSRGDAPLAPAAIEAVQPTPVTASDDIEPEWQPPLTQEVLAPLLPTPAGWQPSLFWLPQDDTATSTARRELARVPVETLDAMLNEAGEISIYRSRLEQQNSALVTQLAEMRQTIVRLREQLRLMDIETDAQIAARGLTAQTPADAADHYGQDFDPLEMDRYSRMQELSRTLAEAVGDLGSLHLTMDQGVNEAQALLLQQGRINTGVQQGLMGTLMVPFSRQVARLQRVVRQTAEEEGRIADVSFEGVESELDRNVLERMTAPLEHLLRNAVVHGLEDPQSRRAAGKPEMGMVKISLKREGTQLVMEVADDGRGLDFLGIRNKAIERGLMPVGTELGDDEIARFIFETGFSTAEKLTQSAGRGVGLDVVASEVKQLGGTLELRSEVGLGTRFTVRLPLSLALSQALMVMVGDETYALPLTAIEGIGRVPRAAAQTAAEGDDSVFTYGGHDYRVRSLAELIDRPHEVPEDVRTVPAVLVRMGEGVAGGERRAALVVDQLLGNREVVSKAVGPQLSSISGLSGATILPNGQVVLMLDPAALVIDRARRRLIAEAAGALVQQPVQAGQLIMVVDDSVTMRRVAERLLQRSGYRVITAKDGLDAIAQLQSESPAAILLDIEMPRADGFEVAGFIRNNERIRTTPIIMITSRSGDKHRARAATLGVDRYLIKPYQEDQLLHELNTLLQQREAMA